ncbi:MAG: hypothetical protein HQK75_05720 [Candidatus Magnetomorum sp.]|nr:hypothetical protein [Candidatus Magnetomorum sp.]
MKYYQIIVCLTLFFIFQSLFVFAEFYKYKDSNGVLRFTDNLAEVPENQRKGVDKYKEYIPPQPPEEKSTLEDIPETSPDISSTIPPAQAPTQQKDQKTMTIQVLGNKISKIQENLQEEYQQLLAEKKALESLDKKSGKKKSTDIESLKNKASALNKRIQEYNQKKTTYLQAIKGYQEKIQSLSTDRRE